MSGETALLSIGREEIAGCVPVVASDGIAAMTRLPHDAVEMLAKLLRENQELTAQLEDHREDILLYEQVAKDVETKWIVSEEVVQDLRAQVFRLMDHNKANEGVIAALASEKVKMAHELERARKLMRLDGGFSSYCAEDRENDCIAPSQAKSSRKSSHDESSRYTASNQDGNFGSFRSFTTTLSGGESDTVKRDHGLASDTDDDYHLEEDSFSDSDGGEDAAASVADEFGREKHVLPSPPVSVCCISGLTCGNEMADSLHSISHSEAGSEDWHGTASSPLTSGNLKSTNTCSSQTPQVFETRVARERREKNWAIFRDRYALGFGFVPPVKGITTAPLTTTPDEMCECGEKLELIVDTLQSAAAADESVSGAAATVAATTAGVDQDTSQRPDGGGGGNCRSASSQTSHLCMGAYISDLLRVKNEYDKLQKELGRTAGGGGGGEAPLGKRDRV